MFLAQATTAVQATDTTAEATATQVAQTAADAPATTEACQGFLACWRQFFSSNEFLTGLAIGAGVILLIWIIKAICCADKNGVKILTVDEQQGKSSITLGAITSFLHFEFQSYPMFSLEKVRLTKEEEFVVLWLDVNVKHGVNTVEVRNEIRTRLFQDMQKQLAIADQVKAINFNFIEMEPNRT